MILLDKEYKLIGKKSLEFIRFFSFCFVICSGISLSYANVSCTNTVTADIVALDQVFYYNRFGAANPSGMIYALKRDVVSMDNLAALTPGNVRLRVDKRPRPLVLRVNQGDCLEVTFTNLLANPRPAVNNFDPPPNTVDPTTNPNNFGDQPATRTASFHVLGMQPTNIESDGSNVGNNVSSLAAPGETKVYKFYAQQEGTYLAYSTAATTGGEGNGGTLSMGLFAAVNVEPAGSIWYRSQVSQQDMALATIGANADHFPMINYDAVYPAFETRKPAESLTLTNNLNGTYKAVMSSTASDQGFIASDQGKTLVAPGFTGTISQVALDGSATITPTSLGVVPNTVNTYEWVIQSNIAHKFAGLPILKILQGTEIVHSNIEAIIKPLAGTYNDTAVNPDRDEPFREFSVIFHDELKSVQAFSNWYEDPVLSHTLHGVKDGFGINYGTGGIGSEIIANRLALGPVKDCVECKYEEFFLTSWALGDPAMVVDVPVSVNQTGRGPNDNPALAPAPVFATKAFYPDDPSNVHHSYLNDHVKFRNIHAGPTEHHIFHLHAHQWVHTPNDDNSAYLDSQTIGPGSAFTYEIAHHGSGNRNKTAGDSIYHCHFYPHFAQGMWAMWRVHDVLELGTVMADDGRPAIGSRAYPDQEIVRGTPITAVIPLPNKAMAPLPGVKVSIDPSNGQVVLPELSGTPTAANNPGYPFFIPGVAGHRPPHPPIDTVADGGLPRHVVTSGTATATQTRLDFNKIIDEMVAQEIDENGTPYEVAAMKFHGDVRSYTTPTPDGGLGAFTVNGLPAVEGAPFADPCVSDNGLQVGDPRFYHAAVIQLDVTLNKAGWHFPQQRILVLNDDVEATMSGLRAPEPLFMRANSGDCLTVHHTNLVPNIYHQDEFQVTTPTDIIGQHIHLVKFDVTSSDGSGNGWNYEDGTFSPEEVHERLVAINAPTGDWQVNGVSAAKPAVCTLGHFENGHGGCIQTTVQRWYADDVLNNSGDDRTLRTVFTHDHYGPSTHQHPGLYAGLVIEPAGSTWRHNETGELLGTRTTDGGPTSWQAIIDPLNEDPYREFMLEIGDFSLAYRGGIADAPVNPPAKEEIGLPDLLAVAPECPGGVPRPCPEAISADDPGTMTVNYRNEPVALRVFDGVSAQTPGLAGDLSYAMESRTDRAIPELNQANPTTVPYAPLTQNLMDGDPFTPMLKAYEGDLIQIRAMIGAHEESHNFSAYGLKWLFEPSVKNSGYNNAQALGISEHFEFITPLTSSINTNIPFVDMPYFPGLATDDVWNGLWGLLRVYNGGGIFPGQFEAPTLAKLPTNPEGKAKPAKSCPKGGKNFNPNCVNLSGVCPTNAPQVKLKAHAYLAKDVLGGPLVYNVGHNLNDPGAIIYVRDKEVDSKTGLLKPGVPIEPLILRANAGDCIHMTLSNHLPVDLGNTQQDGFSTLPMIIDGFNNNDIKPSSTIGFTPQLLEYDPSVHVGFNVGFNSSLHGTTLAKPGKTVKYKWYAGRIKIDELTNKRIAEPVEYGAINLMPSDPIKHVSKGLIAALIIEPQGSSWVEDVDSRASARVTMADGGYFREHVLLIQNDLNLQYNGLAIPNVADADDPEDSGQKGFNYRTEPLWSRVGYSADTDLEATRDIDYTNALKGDIETPIFTATAGEPVRLRVLHPGGHARNNVFQMHGHGWQEQPYTNDSTVIGFNPLSEWKSSEGGLGAGSRLNLLLTNGAGGAFDVTGDFLFRDQAAFTFDGGLWGIFRVEAP